MNPHPVVVVENEPIQQAVAEQLERALGRSVVLVETYPALAAELAKLQLEAGVPEPIVVLDAGIAGICRFDTVKRAVDEFSRARFVQWTAARTVSSHTGALLDGAYASLPKTEPVSTLAGIVDWVATGRRWCQPDQAQWFVELLQCLYSHRDEAKHHVWQSQELDRLPERAVGDAWLRELVEVAEGSDMALDDSWFVKFLDRAQAWWLPPHLRRVRAALAIHPTGATAAAALCIAASTMNGYRTRLAGRLMPHRFLAPMTQDRDHGLVRLLVASHIPCELPAEDHVFTADATVAAPTEDADSGLDGATSEDE